MATFFSNRQVGTWSGQRMYGTLTGNVSRTGNTVTLSGLSCRFTATGGYGSDVNYWSGIYNGNTQLTRSTGLSMSNGSGTKSYSNVSITVGATDTSHTFNFRTSDGYRVDFTVSFPSGQTAPNTPTISISSLGVGEATISYGTTSFGTAGSGTVYLYMATDNSFSDEVEIASKTTTGQSLSVVKNLSVKTTYYFRSRATSSVGNSAYSNIVSVDLVALGILYGSVNGISEKVVEAYGSVNRQTKKIKRLYGSVNRQTKLIYQE